MDPISAAAAIIAATCAVASAANAAQQMMERRKKRKAQEAAGTDLDSAKPEVPAGVFNLSLKVNYLVAKFGRDLETKSNGKIISEVSNLRPELHAVLTGLRQLQADMDLDRTNQSDIEQQWKLLSQQADKLRARIEQACRELLDQFTKRLEQAPAEAETPVLTSTRPLRFCRGALLCQSGMVKASELALAGNNGKTLGFLCSHCFLEVAEYNAVRFSHDGHPVVDSDLMAASHVIACASFADRRAYYKCLACYDKNHCDVDFPSASALEKHMKQHPGYSFIKNREPEAVQATEKKIQDFVSQPIPAPQPVVSRSYESQPDSTNRGISPPSSPEPSSIAARPRNHQRTLPDRPRKLAAPSLPVSERVAAPSRAQDSTPMTAPPSSLPPPPVPTQSSYELAASKFEQESSELPTDFQMTPDSGYSGAVELSATVTGPGDVGCDQNGYFPQQPPLLQKQLTGQHYNQSQHQSQTQLQGYPSAPGLSALHPMSAHQQNQEFQLSYEDFGAGDHDQPVFASGNYANSPRLESQSRAPSRGSMRSFQSAEPRQIQSRPPSQPPVVAPPPPAPMNASQWASQAQAELEPGHPAIAPAPEQPRKSDARRFREFIARK